jgi:hypothetical protein
MHRMSSECSLIPVLLGGALLAVPAMAQEAPVEQGPPGSPIISSDISVSQDAAGLRLELSDGRTVTLQLDEDGTVRLNDEQIGAYERRSTFDRSWRELLQNAMNAPTGTLADLLRGWEPPEQAGGVARRMDRELEAALAVSGQAPGAVTPATPAAPADASDSIRLLNERIRDLERLIEDPDVDADIAVDLPGLRELRLELERDLRDEIREELRTEIRTTTRGWNNAWNSPWRHITRGIGGVFSTLMVYAILVGLGFLAVFFGKSYLEGIADTARHATLRSGLVGLAGSFLVLPAFVLGILALAISIVGIPLLLVYLPLFPVAVVLAALGGYLAVAHGAGEALAERRFTGTDWFTRANSYYYVITGVGLLLVLFIAGHVVSMAGPWLDFLEGLLKFLAVMLTWAAFTIGFGAFLISRGGTRPVKANGAPVSELDEEELHA